jgi:hypothetical protein
MIGQDPQAVRQLDNPGARRHREHLDLRRNAPRHRQHAVDRHFHRLDAVVDELREAHAAL